MRLGTVCKSDLEFLLTWPKQEHEKAQATTLIARTVETRYQLYNRPEVHFCIAQVAFMNSQKERTK